ncbi:hypothetical protein LTR53_009538 [Teratosphaeriaceae sp. CCFEE 6253]|nr:hypothetical protein LTR53_009538 [Teratosphaeriaceae sp. CCFEE 6253]
MSGPSAGNGPGSFLIVIENLPIRYTWQDLKDLIRKEASHGIWTEMALYPDGRTGGKGHVCHARDDHKMFEGHADVLAC